MKKMRLIIGFLLLICALSNSTIAFAEGESNGDEYWDASQSGGGMLATPPECGIGVAEAATFIATLYIAYKTMKMGIELLIQAQKETRPISKAQKAAMGAIILAAGTAVAIELCLVSVIGACIYSFVRDPADRDPDDPTRMRKEHDTTDGTANYTTNYWEAQPVPYSDFVEFCYRTMIPYTYLFADRTCYGVGNANGNDNYDDQNAILCSQEYRNAGFRPEVDEQGKIISDKATGDPSSHLYWPDLIAMKKTSAPVDCRIGVGGDVHHIAGYKYRVRNKGGRICVILDGLGELPGPSYEIGCHYSTPPPPQPMCAQSIPIREDGTRNSNGSIVPGTGTGTIVGYDDSGCSPCYVSMWCQPHTESITQAIIPIASVFIQCVQESTNLVMYGCEDASGNKQGFLYEINMKLQRTLQIVLALAVAFMSAGILMGIGEWKKAEFMAFIVKFTIVVALTTAIPLHEGGGGMEWISKIAYSVATNLSKIVVTAGLHNGLCNYAPSDYVIKRDIMSSNGTLVSVDQDFGYIMVLDQLDCMFFYLMGGQTLTSADLDAGKVATMALNILLLPITLIVSFFDIFGAIFCFLVGLLIVFIMIWCMLFVFLSILGAAIVSILSPIFVPMLLFSVTRGHFDEWRKAFVGFYILSIVLYGYLGFVFSVYSIMFFGETRFVPTMTTIAGNNYKYFAVDESHCFSPDSEDPNAPEMCGWDTRTFGYQMATVEFFTGSLPFGISVTKVRGWGSAGSSVKELARIAIVVFVVYRVIVLIPGLAAELAGGSRALFCLVRFVRSPIEIAKSAKKAITSPAKNKDSDKKGQKGGKGDKGGGDGGSHGSGAADTMKGAGSKAADTISGGRQRGATS